MPLSKLVVLFYLFLLLCFSLQEMITQYGFNLYWGQQKAPYEFVNRPSGENMTDISIKGQPCGDDRSCQCDDRYTDSMVC